MRHGAGCGSGTVRGTASGTASGTGRGIPASRRGRRRRAPRVKNIQYELTEFVQGLIGCRDSTASEWGYEGGTSQFDDLMGGLVQGKERVKGKRTWQCVFFTRIAARPSLSSTGSNGSPGGCSSYTCSLPSTVGARAVQMDES